MTGGDSPLQRVGTQGAGELLGALERREAATHEELVPARPILVEQQNRLTRRTDPCLEPRRLNLHERDEAVDLRVLWRQLGQDAAEPERILAQRGAHPVVAGGRRVALVEHERSEERRVGKECRSRWSPY